MDIADLNKRVALMILGYHWLSGSGWYPRGKEECMLNQPLDGPRLMVRDDPPDCSSDLNVTARVIDDMRSRGWDVSISRNLFKWQASFAEHHGQRHGARVFSATDESLGVAVGSAALSVVDSLRKEPGFSLDKWLDGLDLSRMAPGDGWPAERRSSVDGRK